MELVEQPSAISTVSALRKAFSVMMSLGLMSFSNRSMILKPASLARRILAAMTAGMVPLPGRPIPTASVRQFIELAVNMPEQEPQLGQALSSMKHSSSFVMVPALIAPTASNIWERLVLLPFGSIPASIGPPDTMTVGTLTLAAAISAPGTVLSQLGISTSPSNWWAMAMVSMLSAMSSRETREYFMPIWFMAMPSQTAMAGTSIGVPPAVRMPSLTALAMVSRWMCPGTISFWKLTTPINGRSSSSST